jgi:hypothetical protein
MNPSRNRCYACDRSGAAFTHKSKATFCQDCVKHYGLAPKAPPATNSAVGSIPVVVDPGLDEGTAYFLDDLFADVPDGPPPLPHKPLWSFP